MRDLVNRYNPNVSTNNFPVILGRDGTGKFFKITDYGKRKREHLYLVTLHLGVVSQVGSDVHNLKVGDRVWFVVPYCVQGSLANFLVLDRDFVRPLPASVTFEGKTSSIKYS